MIETPIEPPSADRMNTDSYARFLSQEITPRFQCQAQNAAELRDWQETFRTALAERLGLTRIAKRCAKETPSACKRGEVTLSDHVREEWELESEPGFRFPFFLLRPLDVSQPRPLVLTPHGHSAQGRFIYAGIATTDEERSEMNDGERDIALQAVRQGYIAIAPEVRAFGESMAPEDKAKGKHCSCHKWQMRASLFGRTLIGERVWDIMRLIDFATGRHATSSSQDGQDSQGSQDNHNIHHLVDASKIAITGNSGGGTVSLFAAAMDSRITVAAPGSYFCTFLDSIASIDHCPCNQVPGLLELGEMADVAGLIAPRPFLAIHGKDDPIFPIEPTRRSFENLQKIYSAADVDNVADNAGDRCKLFVGDGGHRYYKEPVWPFVAHWFKFLSDGGAIS